MTSLNINRSLYKFFPYHLNHSVRQSLYKNAPSRGSGCDTVAASPYGWQSTATHSLIACADKARAGRKHFIHTSRVLYSDPLTQRVRSTNPNVFTFNNLNEYINENHSDLNRAVIKYIKDTKPLALRDQELQESSSYTEAFSWLVDDLGKPLDFNQHIDLFKGVNLISHYLEQRYGINTESVSEVKLSELLGPYFNQDKVRIIELYNHVSRVYNSDKQNFIGKITKNVDSLGVVTDTDVGDNIEPNISNSLNNSSRPLGEYGDITLNEMVVSLRNFNWQFIIQNTEATVNI